METEQVFASEADAWAAREVAFGEATTAGEANVIAIARMMDGGGLPSGGGGWPATATMTAAESTSVESTSAASLRYRHGEGTNMLAFGKAHKLGRTPVIRTEHMPFEDEYGSPRPERSSPSLQRCSGGEREPRSLQFQPLN